MLRTFDHAGYYETRLIVMAISFAIACYFFYYKGDRRHLLMFASGAFFWMLMEYLLQSNNLRGAGYSISVFGITVPKLLGPVLQGLGEGGVCGMVAFWFAELRSAHARLKQWLPFWGICLLLILLAFFVGAVAQYRPISSIRPMFATSSTLIITTIIFGSILIAWHKDALPALANYFGGLMLFALLTLVPLHMMGVRYIGIHSGLQVVEVTMPMQFFLPLLSLIVESAGGKLHYFMLPFAFGLIRFSEREDQPKRERYSTQHLQDLAQRGWRKRTNPFQREN